MLSRHRVRTAIIRARLVPPSFFVVTNGSQEAVGPFPFRPPPSVAATNHVTGVGPFLSGRTASFSSSSTISEERQEDHHGGETKQDENNNSAVSGSMSKKNDAMQMFFEKKRAVLEKEGQSFGSANPLSSSSSLLLSSFSMKNNNRNSRQPHERSRLSGDGQQQTVDADNSSNANHGRESLRRLDYRDGSRRPDDQTRNINSDYRNHDGRSHVLSINLPQQQSRQRERHPPLGGDQSSQKSSQQPQGNYNNRGSMNREHGNHFQNRKPSNYTNNKNRNQYNNGAKDINLKRDEPDKTYRLADLMQQFRKDAPPAVFRQPSSSSSSSSSSLSASGNMSFPLKSAEDRRDSSFPSATSYRSSWRELYAQEQKQHHQRKQQGQDGQVQRRRDAGNRNKGGGPPPLSEDFLQGRLPRTETEKQHSGSGQGHKPSTDNVQRKAVTLPNFSLSLVEASALLRIKVDDIKSKLRDMGEGRLLVSERASVLEDGDNDDSRSTKKSNRNRRSGNSVALDVDMLELVAMEFGIETVRSTNETLVVDAEQLLMQQRRTEVDTATVTTMASHPSRPPVVCIMGHVDHGKTTLMDALRRRAQEQQKKKREVPNPASKKMGGTNVDPVTKNVAGTEAGGITQMISAFQVTLDGQEGKITFLDTPGHAAFRSMRQSGSHAADVIVLVVAADDGVSPQTIEILEFYKSIVKGSSDSGISMVVALNKVDRPGIDVDEAKIRIENQLLEHGIVSEGMTYTESEYGQPVQVIPTSGLTGLGLDDLMEGLLLQSEIMDLRADPESHAEGIVMDARLEKGLGVVADCIIRWGKIEKDDVVVCGNQVARVRMLKDVNDKMLARGLPSQPVRIIGFKCLPKAGEPLFVVESEEVAEEIVEQRLAMETAGSDRPDGSRSDMELHIHGMRRRDTKRVQRVHQRAAIDVSDGSVRIPIIVKAEADGSLSAVRESLMNLGEESDHKVVIDPVAEGIGEVTISDIQMAKESEATIFAFGLKRIDQSILNLAEAENVTICSNDIIYSLLDKAKDVLGSYLPPVAEEHVHGRALVQAVFTIDTSDGNEKVAGLKVMDGHMYKAKAPNKNDSSRSSTSADLNCHFRILRDRKQISPNGESVTASSLRRFKELVESVRMGDECGLALLGFTDFEEGDEIECYSIEMKQGKL